MKAVRLGRIGSPLQDMEAPLPKPGPGEVLVRIRASGVCHSDAHYRNGTAPPPVLPVTLGHEVAGVIAAVGTGVSTLAPGNRVALHYLVSCRSCEYCIAGVEQFCPTASMIGKYRDGGFAEYIAVPAFNAVRVPDAVPLEWAAVMMCSTATAYHAVRKSRFVPGERAAVFGVGGLGLSAVQLLVASGAREVFAVDLDRERLELAARYGATPIRADGTDPVLEIEKRTGGRGVEVALELLGNPITIDQSFRSLARRGRAAVAGITNRPVEIDTYRHLVGKEAELIGVSDHLRSELDYLLDLAAMGKLDLAGVVTERIALDAGAINETLDRLERFGKGVRTVVVQED
jgi:2-desacetyl-2-hydroxyethyl bacteriochlorophyllide A dehydrogenase